MKKTIITLFVLLSGFTLSAQVRGDYSITGDLRPLISSLDVAPDSLSLILMRDHEIDSIALHQGQFEYSATVNARYVLSAYLRLLGPGSEDEALSLTIPVYLEPGNIRIWCRELPDEDIFDIVVEGTPSNNLMSHRISEYYDLNYRMLDVSRDTLLDDEERFELITTLYQQQDSIFRYLYRDNRESPIAPSLAIQQFYGTNNFEEAGQELAWLNERFPGHPDLHDLESVWMSMEGISIGDTVPDFWVTSKDGNPVHFTATFQGEPLGQYYTLYDFWSSLSGPSIGDFSALKKLPETYNGLPLYIVGINTDNSREVWLKSLKRYKPAGIQHWDEDHKVSRAFHITSYPARFLVDPEGIVIAKGNFTTLPNIKNLEEEELFYEPSEKQ